jgi:transposase
LPTTLTLNTLFDRLVGISTGWTQLAPKQNPSDTREHQAHPYSPELNPVEQLWKGLRSRFFGNAVFETLEAVEDPLENALRWVEANTDWVKSFAYYPYIQHAI